MDLEKYSSAITLSDMEVFVFPELMYSLVLANIMSPRIWRWRRENSFRKLKDKNRYRKLMRLKQYIMDNYVFNLDLQTWGLTNKDTELGRFADYLSPEQIVASNALFGYHGDKYYFDVDIRRHFGLDKYDEDLIPYWKTETVEAMDAFVHKPDYDTAAGECVSLSTLYAAAAFIVCQISLDSIYMILTPLHSQNFLSMRDGILTNNRRIVTKTMWFNGSAISNKAQRALRNEQVTIVAHNSGYIHCLYDKATIDKKSYEHFRKRLRSFLSTRITTLIIANFLRTNRHYQKFFQFCCEQCRGGRKYANAEVLFHYEHGSKYRIADDTFEKLIEEVSREDLNPYKLPNRLCCKQLADFIEYEKVNILTDEGKSKLADYIGAYTDQAGAIVEDLADFVHIEPRLPDSGRQFVESPTIKLDTEQSREDIIEYLQSMRDKSEVADLAFYAYRDMENCDWRPFTKAAIERNPVTLQMLSDKNTDQACSWLKEMPDESIYDGSRLAQPDEVTNFKTGDGLEKAFTLAAVLRQKRPDDEIELICDDDQVVVRAGAEYRFGSAKGLRKCVRIAPDGKIATDD